MKFELVLSASKEFKIKHSYTIRANDLVELCAKIPLIIAQLMNEIIKDDDVPF